MSKILPIVLQPHPVLLAKATPVSQVDNAVRTTLDAMTATLQQADGIGLAGNQVAVLQRLVVMDVGYLEGKARGDERPERRLAGFVNPEIVARSTDTVRMQEGCLSLPDVWAEVERSAHVTVRWLDREGAPQEGVFDGLAAVCWQHEIDHLDGVLFVQRLSALKRDMALKKWKKIRPLWLENPPYDAHDGARVVRAGGR